MALPLEAMLQRAEALGFTVEEQEDSNSSLARVRQLNIARDLQKEIERLIVETEQRKAFLEDPSPSMASQIARMDDHLRTILDHIQKVVLHKDTIVSYLQQPFAGAWVVVPHGAHRDFVSLVAKASAQISALPQVLNTLKWVSTFTIDDGQLEKRLAHLSSAVAKCQLFSESLKELREVVGEYQGLQSPPTLTP